MTSEGLTAAKLAEVVGVQPSTVSHVLSGRNYPSFDFIANLLKAYPLLNPRWLLLGEGDIYGQDQSLHTPLLKKAEPEKEIPQPKTVPVIDLLDAAKNASNQKVGINSIPEPHNDERMLIHKEIAEKIVIFYSDGTFSIYNSK